MKHYCYLLNNLWLELIQQLANSNSLSLKLQRLNNLINITRARLQNTFTFPHPVNEIAARWVAAMVAVLAFIIILTNLYWLLFVLLYGFIARVLTGPTLSIMGLLSTKLIVPALGSPSKLVPGPPKRFAQVIGGFVTTVSIILSYGFGLNYLSEWILGVLLLFAVLESCVSFCAGCYMFGYLMKWGLIPEDVCQRCNNLSF